MKLLLLGLSTSIILFSVTHPAWSSRTETDPTANPTANPSTNPTANPTANPTTNPTASKSARFTCQTINNQNTVVYHPQNRSNESYPWAIPGQMGGGWNSLARCQEISRRLEAYRGDGLKDLRISSVNGYNTICVTTEKNNDCRIVLTVPPQQDPIITRDRVFRNLTAADSGQRMEGVATFGDNNSIDGLLGGILRPGNSSPRQLRNQRDPIDLKPFLSREDGGFGTQLNNPQYNTRPSTKPVDNSSPYRLNPDNFR